MKATGLMVVQEISAPGGVRLACIAHHDGEEAARLLRQKAEQVEKCGGRVIDIRYPQDAPVRREGWIANMAPASQASATLRSAYERA